MLQRAKRVSATIDPAFADRAQARRQKREDQFREQVAIRQQEAELLKPIYDAVLANVPPEALARLAQDREAQRNLVLKSLANLPPLPDPQPVSDQHIMYLEWLLNDRRNQNTAFVLRELATSAKPAACPAEMLRMGFAPAATNSFIVKSKDCGSYVASSAGQVATADPATGKCYLSTSALDNSTFVQVGFVYDIWGRDPAAQFRVAPWLQSTAFEANVQAGPTCSASSKGYIEFALLGTIGEQVMTIPLWDFGVDTPLFASRRFDSRSGNVQFLDRSLQMSGSSTYSVQCTLIVECNSDDGLASWGMAHAHADFFCPQFIVSEFY